MFPGFSTGFAAALDDALFGADVTSFQVERSPLSWRSPAGELVEAVRVHVWLDNLEDVRRVLPRLGLSLIEPARAVPMWGGWMATDAAAGLPFPVAVELTCYGAYTCDLVIADDGSILPAAGIEQVG